MLSEFTETFQEKGGSEVSPYRDGRRVHRVYSDTDETYLRPCRGGLFVFHVTLMPNLLLLMTGVYRGLFRLHKLTILKRKSGKGDARLNEIECRITFSIIDFG